ncbi:MAG: VacB/RNase II family 3'-5' exoribonuclease [Proteobacteria bacterium]|nr:VacB/RNase II family 3'-5' exoribonuclease [Pseudomonadota bacterium]
MHVTGSITVHPRGFGFLAFSPDGSGRAASAFIIPPDLNPFLTDDVVTAEVSAAADGRWNAADLALVSRPRTRVMGEVVMRGRAMFLRIDREVSNTDWPLHDPHREARRGDAVVARLDEARAVVECVLGPDDDVAFERLLLRHDLQAAHAATVLAEATEVQQRAVVVGHRRDLRDMTFVTIDGPSTRDIDDAVGVLPAASDGALRLFVAIADPAEHVRDGTVLDRDARARATSVYLSGRVLSMLPESISADRLSLWPDVDREVLAVEMRIDAEGRVVSVDLHEAVIRSRARLTYEEVECFLHDGSVSEAMRDVRAVMPWLRTAASRLDIARRQRGGVSMARDEAALKVDASGQVMGVELQGSPRARALVERCMVAANEAVARWLEERGVPAPYRVHAEPEPSHVVALSECAHHFGYEAGLPPVLTPLALAAFDTQITGVPAEPAMRAVLRRTLGPARYTVTPGLHFGLAASRYLHFTSPLRRYADLAVHRAVKAWLRGQRDFTPLDPEVETLARHLNDRTAAAGKAEADWHRVLAARWMTQHIGQVYAGRVVRVKSFGVLVQLDASFVEGLLPLESLPGGDWRVDPREVSVGGPGGTLAVGVPVQVRVKATDTELGRIELALVTD